MGRSTGGTSPSTRLAAAGGEGDPGVPTRIQRDAVLAWSWRRACGALRDWLAAPVVPTTTSKQLVSGEKKGARWGASSAPGVGAAPEIRR